MYKVIKIADIPIGIHTLYDPLYNAEPFVTEQKPLFTVSVTEHDIINEQKKVMAEAAFEKKPCPSYSAAALENTAVYRKIAAKLPEYNACVFHGAAVAIGNKAFLFTAKSGTGKTTHARLWLKNIDGSYIVNGDKPVLRIMDGKPFVCGTPWMGKENLGCNKNVPLFAICFLHRATVNHLEPTEAEKALPRLIGQSHRPADGDLIEKTVRLLSDVRRSVGLYDLYCNMEDEAVSVAYGGMCDGKV